MAGVTSYYREPVKTMEVNAVGTYSVLEAIKDLKLDRFVYFSTSEVYGPLVFGASEDQLTSQGNMKQRRWTYGISKLAGEAMSFAYAQQYSIPVSSIRPFNIYGPGQVGEGAIQIFARLAINDETIEVTNDGNQIRAWCYIDDFIDATVSILSKKEAIGEVFNIGDPAGTITILNLAKDIIRLTKSKSNIKFIPHPGTDIDLRVPNIQKAKTILGYSPKISLEEGLKRSLEWYKNKNIVGPLI
jgi:dTDP-glucose 4,6-dehydratase